MHAAAIALLAAGALALGATPAAASIGRPGPTSLPTRISAASPFGGCPVAGLDPWLPTGEVEPVVAADPEGGRQVVAAWTQDRFRGIIAAVSPDQGRSWRRTVVPQLTRCTGGTFDYADDLSVHFASDGAVHLLAHGVDADRRRSGILATRSTDGGRTWHRPVLVTVQTGSRDGEYAGGAITADRSHPRTVYAVAPTFSYPAGPGGSYRGKVVFADSRDGGRTWRPARVILDTGPGRLTTGHQLVVARDATLVDVFTLIDLSGGPQRPRTFVAVTRSPDRGHTWSEPVVVAELGSAGITDPDTGEAVASGTRLQPAAAVDPSTGRIYVAWQDARFSGGQADAIALAWSADGARTWTAPIKVNATPADLPNGQQQAFAPALAVAKDHTVGVSYYDFRRDRTGDGALATDRWLMRCRPTVRPLCSGPGTAGTETRLTASPFDLRRAHRFTTMGPPGYFLGDYMGLTTTGPDFLAVFAQPHGEDPASVFAARRRTHTS